MRKVRISKLGGPAFFAAGVAVFALLPIWISEYRESELTIVGIYFISLIGLNILIGYSGQISLGHGAFMGIGAYTTAILVTKADFDEYLAIPVAAVITGVIGFLFGFPALRLTGVYLALATFGLAVAFIELVKSERFAGLTEGSGGIQLGLPTTPYYLTWSIALGVFLLAWLLLRGRLGRRLRAVRDAPIAAVSSGVNLALAKTTAFGIAAAYAGTAGALMAILNGFIGPFSFPVALSITMLVGAALGGLGSLAGVIFGALFIFYAPLKADDIAKEAPAVMYGFILLVVLFLLPGGAAQLPRRVAQGLKLLTSWLYTRRTSEG